MLLHSDDTFHSSRLCIRISTVRLSFTVNNLDEQPYSQMQWTLHNQCFTQLTFRSKQSVEKKFKAGPSDLTYICLPIQRALKANLSITSHTSALRRFSSFSSNILCRIMLSCKKHWKYITGQEGITWKFYTNHLRFKPGTLDKTLSLLEHIQPTFRCLMGMLIQFAGCLTPHSTLFLHISQSISIT